MPKVISIICESLNFKDVEQISLRNSVKYHMDMRPSMLSATSLYLMQTGDPVPDMGNCHSASEPCVFSPKGRLISNYVKTRIISNYWPRKFDASFLDPKSSIESGLKICREPNSHHYPVLLDFLKHEFYDSDYQYLIYWSLIGHGECYDCRIDEENKGVPYTLRKTAAEWFRLIDKDILPLVKQDTLVMIHPDHGTARKGQGPEAYTDGFMFLYPKEMAKLIPTPSIYWSTIRGAIRRATGVDQAMRTAKCSE